MPAKAGSQVTDSGRQTVGKRYPGDDKDWIPAYAGMTNGRVDF
jgi:hypothetical protein